MKNSIKAKIQKALNNSKGFTLVELIVVTVIIMILATMATSSYLRFVEDAKVAKDTAYVKNIVTQVEVLIANDKLDIPSANKSSTNYTSYDDTFAIKVNSDGTWYSAFDAAPIASTTTGDAEDNLDLVQANCTKQELTSTSAKINGVEIRVQIYNDVPHVFVYSVDDSSWYPYTRTWAGEGAW
ncbi:MAG: type II secretion system protein [Clostridia bacterium]